MMLGGDTKDEQVIEKPTKPTDPTVDPDDPTVDPDDPTVDPDDPTVDPDDPTVDPDDPTVDPDDPTIDPDAPTVDPDDPTIDPDAPTVDPDNPTVDPDDPTIDPDDPVIYGEEPYDKAIGNGNYILHNFIGENDKLTAENIVDGTNHYLGKAETYLKDLASNWNESMKDRPAAQNYFADLITAVQNDQYFYIDENYPDRTTFDTAVNKISRNANTYFADIIKNLDNEDDRYAFYTAYRIFANESYKEGLGSYRKYSSPQMDEYEEEKNFLIELANANKLDGGPFVNVDIEQDYNTNNFAQTTNIVDTMINTVVNNMNNNRNLDLQASDLRQLINLGITTNLLEGMHDYTKGNLHHTMCEMGNNIVSTMNTAMTEVEQSQTMGL